METRNGKKEGSGNRIFGFSKQASKKGGRSNARVNTRAFLKGKNGVGTVQRRENRWKGSENVHRFISGAFLKIQKGEKRTQQ